ncbi:MAG TPA: AMP-binding protein [Thermoanaerobaculia bacterium]|nr:AMP-binding protein [Thermoanaerobaculia bacterium]
MAAVTIAERFHEMAAQFAESEAIVSPRERIAYAELAARTNDVAAMLLARKLPRDRPVALVMRDPIALVPAILGTIQAGHFFVVIDAGDPAERIEEIVAHSEASARVTDADLARATRVASRPTAAAHDLLQLVFTSGTTGRPKAVIQPQRGIVARILAQSSVTGRTAGARVSYTALPGFARATFEILGTLLTGATLCAWDARSEPMDALAGFIARERVSVLTLTPALFRRFVAVAPHDADFTSVRKLRIGADVMTLADFALFQSRFPRTCTLERSFNATETGNVLHVTLTHDTPLPGPLVPVGRPRPNVEVRLVDEEGRDVPDGTPGEMLVTSPFVAGGYWNDPELTAKHFTFHGDMRTFASGDLLIRDEEGLFFFIGRKDARLKIHGRRIDPLEVETALLRHPAIREAVAFGRPDANGEMQLAACVVMRDETPFAAREIRAALRETTPAHLIPSRLEAIETMPMTAAGKVDRTALAARVEQKPEVDDASGDDLERTIVAIWSRVLGTSVAAHDHFFDDLGGQSVVAAHLVAEVRKTLDRTLPLSLLLELDTPAKMADYLRLRVDRERLAVVVQRGDGATPPLFCVSGKGGSVIVFRALAERLGDRTVIGLTHDGFAAETFPKTFASMAACYVDAIRELQPEGPYHVCGYSAGGMVALDIARQLRHAGHDVAFTGMIDTALDGTLAPKWRRLFKHAVLLRKHPRTHAPRYARAMGRRVMALARWILGRGWSLYAEPPEVPALNAAYNAIRKRDALQRYDGPVTLFLARHGWGTDALHRDLGWRRWCPSLEIVEVEGEHHTVLREDVDSLAEAIRSRIVGR